MTSLQIAEITGKRHSDVLEAIRKMEPAWEKVSERNFPLADYIDQQGKSRPMYILSKTESLYVATKFNDEARAKLVLRWEQLEMEKMSWQNRVPTSFREALLLAAQQQEQIERQKDKIESQQQLISEKNEQVCQLTDKVIEMGKKVSYLDQILANKSTILTTAIAQDYGMSAKTFNKMLNDYGIQHKVDKQWILYAPYLTEGYVHSKQIEITHADGSKKIHLNTEWTQKGRLFLYQKLKSKGVVPMIEK
jgi:phage antirepressor YoqD-like protein